MTEDKVVLNKATFLKNKTFVNFIFMLLILLGIFSLFWSYYCHRTEINIPDSGYIYADIRLNIETSVENSEKIHVLSSGGEISKYVMKTCPDYITYEINRSPVYYLGLHFDGNDKEVAKGIKNIVLSVSNKLHYYTGSDVLKFKRLKNGTYLFPNDIKYEKKSAALTDKGSLKHFTFGVLSVFYNSKFYIFPLTCFFLAILIYLSNKDKINLGFSIFKNYAIWWIALIALIFRITDTGYSFWTDELYVSTVAGNPNSPFSAVFSDPGNPPLFFILARYWEMIFGRNEQILRLLPCIFSIAALGVIYVFVKYYVNKNAALFCSFLYAINIYSLGIAHEYRCYSFLVFLAILSAFCLFRIFETKKNKYFIYYGIVAILMANTHYFEILILIGNFLFAMFFLDNKSRIKLFITNCIAALSFLPYFLATALNKGLLNSDFNILPKPTINEMFLLYCNTFFNKAAALLVLCVGIYALIRVIKAKGVENREEKATFLYLFMLYSTVWLFLSAYLFSYIRPIIRHYYFVSNVGFAVIVSGLLFFLPYERKTLMRIITAIVLIFSFNNASCLSKLHLLNLNFESLVKYAYHNSVNYPNKKIGIVFHDTIKYADFYKDIIRPDTVIILYSYDDIDKLSNEIIPNSEAEVIYLRTRFKRFPQVVQMLSSYCDVSAVRVYGDGIMLVRAVKKKIQK